MPRKTQGTLEQIERLSQQRETLNDEIRDTQKLLRQIDAEERKLKTSLIASIGKAPGGILETSRATYKVDVFRDYSLDADVKKKAAEEFPEAWAAITSWKPSIRCKVTPTSKEAAPKEQPSEDAV